MNGGPARIACLLLCLLAAAPGSSRPTDDGPLPAVRLAGVELTGAAAGGGAAWSQSLVELWRQRYGLWAQLFGPDEPAADTAAAAPLAAQALVRVEEVPEGLRVRVTLQGPEAKAESSQVLVWGRSLPAAAQAAAGELAWLLASRGAFPEPLEPPPSLAAIISLDSLALLRDAAAAASAPATGPGAQALGIHADPDGLRLLLADRVLSLGPLLEISRQTSADLLSGRRFPAGFVPAALSVNALGETCVYDAGSGELLLYPAGGGPPERHATGIVHPVQAGALAGGTLAALQGRSLWLLHRRGAGLQATTRALPSNLAAALSAERPGELWVYDLAERRIRLLDAAGQEAGSVKPLLHPAAVPVPQVLRSLPEGGFLLGGAGELWSLGPEGLPRFRLRELGTTPRESLPAYFAAAPARVPQGGPPALFLLDPLGRRLMRFVEHRRDPAGAADPAGSSLEARLAEAHERLAADPDSRAELIGLCLREGLLLQARYLFSLGQAGPQAAASLDTRILERQADCLAELAREREEQLRLPEAEQAYNGALALLRELRGLDPVERRFPKAIAELSAARNAVREILVAEPLLEVGPVAVLGGEPAPGSRSFQLRLPLRSLSTRSLEELDLDLRLAVSAAGPASLQRHWGITLGPLTPWGRQELALPVSVERREAAEDLRVQLHFLFSFREQGTARRQHAALWALLPADAEAEGRPGP